MHTILVLDDDPIDSAQLVDDLAAEGCKVLKASPFSAINAIQAAEQIDAVTAEPKSILLDRKGGAYSSLSMVNDRTLGILYESSVADMVFQKIKLSEFGL